MKYRRKNSSSSHAISKLIVLSNIFVLGFILLILNHYNSENVLSLKNIDPSILTSLKNNKPITVFASFNGSYPKNSCEKVWNFGNIHICLMKIYSRSELNYLINHYKVLSILSCKSPKPIKRYFLTAKTQYIFKYDFRKEDIDNKFDNFHWMWCGKGVTVAIIDTGIDYLNPDFYDVNGKTIIKALVSCLYTINGSCLVNNTTGYNMTQMWGVYEYDHQFEVNYGQFAYEDRNGHGTHVAGIIAGRGWVSHRKYIGIAPCSKLVIIKAFNKNGSAGLSQVLNALEWCYKYCKDYNVTVLSLSWGIEMPSIGNDPVSLAVSQIAKEGITVFVAAGNNLNIPGTITTPAVDPDVLTVGAWDPYYNKLAWFSSMGPTRNGEIKPDFVAPGVYIVSVKSQFAVFPNNLVINYTNGSYVALSGTSMATPDAAGCFVDFEQWYYNRYHKLPNKTDFINFEKVNGIRYDNKKDFIEGYAIIQCP